MLYKPYTAFIMVSVIITSDDNCTHPFVNRGHGPERGNHACIQVLRIHNAPARNLTKPYVYEDFRAGRQFLKSDWKVSGNQQDSQSNLTRFHKVDNPYFCGQISHLGKWGLRPSLHCSANIRDGGQTQRVPGKSMILSVPKRQFAETEKAFLDVIPGQVVGDHQ